MERKIAKRVLQEEIVAFGALSSLDTVARPGPCLDARTAAP
jgi:hypothetical protein